jgi:DNA-binding transcriptional LysR family regulator
MIWLKLRIYNFLFSVYDKSTMALREAALLHTAREVKRVLEQIRYFQAVVRCNSFTEAAEECHISQSAISQQIKALEQELGVQLLMRHNRRFELTPAGEHFYKRSLNLVADYDQLVQQTVRMARRDNPELRIGYLKSYAGPELQMAVGNFSAKHPKVSIHIMNGNHEDLYDVLRTGKVDLVLNDQRRAFSDLYVNLSLSTRNCYVELAGRSALAGREQLTVEELKEIPCILIASKQQQQTEETFYRTVLGFQGEFLFAENLEEARLMIARDQGFMPIEGGDLPMQFGGIFTRVPLYRDGAPVTRRYCAFWKKDNSGYYVEEFADMLLEQFRQA